MPPRVVPTESVRKPRRKQRGAKPCIVQGPVGWCEACEARVILPCVACRARATLAKVRRGNREPRQDLVLHLEGEELERYKAYRARLGIVNTEQ